MKKLLINLLAISGVAVFAVACSSGSSGGGSTTPPAVVAVPATVPVGFVPVGNNAASNPIALNIGAGDIAVPVNGAYQTFAMPTNVAQALAGLTPQELQTVDVSSDNGSNVILSIPPAIAGGAATVYVLTPPPQAQSKLQATAALSAESYTIPSGVTVTTNIITIPATALTNAGISFGGESVNFTGLAIVPANNTGLQTVTTPLSSCAGATGIPSVIKATQYPTINPVGYVGVGTSTGSVCVLSGASLQFTNVSAQAPVTYVPAYVTDFGFAPVANNIVGYWGESAIGGTKYIWRTVATGLTSGTVTSFYNVISSAAQTFKKGQPVTFTNTPPSVASMYVDANNNLYVGTNTGSVYKLATGFTTWTSTTLYSGVGAAPVYLSPTSNQIGTTATTLAGTANPTVFTVN